MTLKHLLKACLFIQCLSLNLKFKNNRFRIILISDTHYNYQTNSKHTIDHIQNTAQSFVKTLKPDLIIYTGDIIDSDDNLFYRTNGFFEKNWKLFQDLVLKTKTPYLYAIGNHDPQSDLTIDQIHEIDKNSFLNARKHAISSYKQFNYVIKLESKLTNPKIQKSITLLWIFDTNGQYGCNNNPFSYGCVEKDQIQWYETTLNNIKQTNNESKIHSFIFQHVPPPEILQIIQNSKVYNFYQEFICCPIENTGFIDSLIQSQSVQAIFFGHDHKNSFGGKYKGIEMAYIQNGFQSGMVKILDIYDNNEDEQTKYEHYYISLKGKKIYNTQKQIIKVQQNKCLQAIPRFRLTQWYKVKYMIGLGVIIFIISSYFIMYFMELLLLLKQAKRNQYLELEVIA